MTPSSPVRIAMWSGPRTISTALMRSWENRHDTLVVDEPFYAHYLYATGAAGHPMTREIIEHYGRDWRLVADMLTARLPKGVSIFYQKHMAHHLLSGMDREWMAPLTHCFLIRNSKEMLISLAKVLPHPTLADTGLETQVDLFRETRRHAETLPPVIDSRDVLENPRGLLSRLCDALGIPFDEAMLSWPPGPRKTDGIWAPYWYAAVEQSTGFQPYRPRSEALPMELTPLWKQCVPLYEELASHKLTA